MHTNLMSNNLNYLLKFAPLDFNSFKLMLPIYFIVKIYRKCTCSRGISSFSTYQISLERQLNREITLVVVPKLVTYICIVPAFSNYKILQQIFMSTYVSLATSYYLLFIFFLILIV